MDFREEMRLDKGRQFDIVGAPGPVEETVLVLLLPLRYYSTTPVSTLRLLGEMGKTISTF